MSIQGSDRPSPAGRDTRKILLLGANRSNVLAIRSLRRGGFFTVVADPRPESPGLREADLPLTIDVRECDRILASVHQIGGVDGIVSMSEVGVEPAAYMCAQLALPSISEAVAANVRSKAAMRRLWAPTGFSVEFEVAENEQQAVSAVDRLGLPLIFKPDRSFGGSRGVSRVQRREQVLEAFRFATQSGLPGTSVVIERCITGAECSCEVLIHEGRSSVLCVGQKVKSPPPYRVDLSVQYPAALSLEQEEAVARMCQAAVLALGLEHGAAHVEFAYTASGPLLLEIAARCGGGHTPQITHAVSGVDEFREVCRMACGDPPSQLSPVRNCGADYRFVIFRPGQARAVHLPEDVFTHPGILDAGVLVKSGDEIRPVRTTADRAGFVVARGSSRAEAVELADWACTRISISYSDGSVGCALPLGACLDVTP